MCFSSTLFSPCPVMNEPHGLDSMFFRFRLRSEKADNQQYKYTYSPMF